MKAKKILTSIAAIAFAMPAMAETFPQDGYMLENKTYDNAATSTNMDGVYQGSVNANAEYEDILYTIAAGQYLPAGSVNNQTQCTAGSFCPGLQNTVTYDANNDQGITSCSTVGDHSYTLSDLGYKICKF